MDTVVFEVYGEPVGKGRPRFSTYGKYVQTYTPEKTVNYENLIKLAYQSKYGGFQFPENVPLEMRIYAYLSIPKSASKKKQKLMETGKIRPIKKPDSSNITKAVEDALNKIAYHDDSQIVESQISRYYARVPQITVVIQEVKKEVIMDGE